MTDRRRSFGKRDMRLYAEAGEIITIAMGRERVKYPREGEPTSISNAALDPLAWWCGVEAIVSAAKRYAAGRALINGARP